MAKGRAGRKRKVRGVPIMAPLDATPERIARATELIGNDVVRHHDMVDAEIERAGERPALARRFVDSHIDRMRKRGHLTYPQWFAADWYRTLHAQAISGSRVVANYGEGAGGAGNVSYGNPRNEAQVAARKTLRQARTIIAPAMLVLVERLVVEDTMPCLRNGQQRARYAASIGTALDPLALWIHAPGAA
jgi:hypothetical protein